MTRPEVKLPAIDMDSADNKRRVLSQVGALKGVYSIELKPRRDRRSLQQLAWYWGCIVEPFYQALKEQDPTVISAEDAHEALKGRFLMAPVCDPETGEVLSHRVGSTRNFDTVQMAAYCENCRDFLAQWFGIVVPDPDPNWASEQKSPSRGLTTV